jgi:hypothetical protein
MLDEYLNKAKSAGNAPAKSSDASPTPEAKVNGVNGLGVENMSQTNANGNSVPTSGDKPKPRRPFGRVMKPQLKTETKEQPDQTSTGSPPSGKRETDELGKISSEDISPKWSTTAVISSLDGEPNDHVDGIQGSKDSQDGPDPVLTQSPAPVNGHASVGKDV